MCEIKYSMKKILYRLYLAILLTPSVFITIIMLLSDDSTANEIVIAIWLFVLGFHTIAHWIVTGKLWFARNGSAG